MARMWRNRNPHTLLVGLQIGVATMENSMEVPQKIKTRTSIWPSNFNSEYLSKGIQNTNSKRYMYTCVHCSIIYNSQDRSSPSHRQLDKEGVVHIHNEILLGHNKEWNLTISKSMDGPGAGVSNSFSPGTTSALWLPSKDQM